jgi:HK97 family phage major capsid protein
VQVSERNLEQSLKAETHRASEILAIASKYAVPTERALKAINDNEPLDQFRKYVLEEVVKAKPVTASPNVGMNDKEKKRYSLLRALSLVGSNQPLDGLEREASDAAAKLQKREAPAAGFVVPHDISTNGDPEMIRSLMRVSPWFRHQMERVMSANVFTAGGATVATDLLAGSLIELLRNRTVLNSLGVVNLAGLVGNVAIPKQTSAGTAYWLDEQATGTRSNQGVSQLGLVPKRLMAGTAYTKQLLAQSSLDAEAFVRDDLMRVLALAKDLAGFAGTGGAQPLGIVNTPLVSKVTFSAAATLAKILEFETDVATANADIGTMNWVTNITVRNKWKQIAKIGTTFPVFLCSDDNKANGYPVNITNQVPVTANLATNGFSVNNQVIFGVFSQAITADWAGMDVVVDPYSLATSNQIAVTVGLFTDFGLRHPESFAISTDSGAQ